MMINFRSPCSFRSRLLYVIPAALAPLVLALTLVGVAGAAPGDDSRAPDLGDCQILQVEAGNKVSFHGFGVGVQIYTWDGANWIFVAPEATLYANAGDNGEIASHFGGPTWQSNGGSKVVGTVLQHCPAPDPGAIPWLLLASVPELTEGPGIFADVTFIQRVNTVGGIAPADPGTFVGEIARVPYTADYYFYRKHN